MLPEPRLKLYESSNYDKIQENVLEDLGQLIEQLGVYPTTTYMRKLFYIEITSYASMFLGLIFSVLIFLFLFISILLIYSLLMITVEEKAFDAGIMRLQGLSKKGYLGSILFQAVLFVLPSIFFGYLSSLPALYLFFEWIFSNQADSDTADISCLPSADATVKSLILGFFIPFVATILPIHVALKKTLS